MRTLARIAPWSEGGLTGIEISNTHSSIILIILVDLARNMAHPLHFPYHKKEVKRKDGWKEVISKEERRAGWQ